MKEIMKRLSGFALSLALVAGMLPVSVFAAEECSHENLKKGVCQNESCQKKFVAVVGDTFYEELTAAVMAASQGDSGSAVTLLTDLDLKGSSLSLGAAYLAVSGPDEITVENGTVTSKHEQQAIYNGGKLVLKNVTVTNSAGTYAVFAEGSQETAAKLTVNGGSYSGKHYGIGVKNAELQLNGYVADQGEGEVQPEQMNLPQIVGETAALHLDESMIAVMCDLGGSTYSVDCSTPGEFAHISDYNTDYKAKGTWFTNDNVRFDEATGKWSVHIPEEDTQVQAVLEVKALEGGFVYNGGEIKPEVIVKNGDTEIPSEEYEVTYTNNVNAGSATVTVTDKEGGKITFAPLTAAFEIDSAELTVLSAEAADKVYDGDNTVVITGITLEGKCDGDDVSVSLDGVNGTLSDAEIGSYDKVTLPTLTLVNNERGNYRLIQPTAPVDTNVTIGTNSHEAVLEVEIPEGGFVYTGNAITPEVVVKIGGTVVPETAYEVSYQNNVNAGTATVTVKAKADSNYTFAELTETFEIKKASPTALTISGQPATVTYGDQAFQLTVSGGIGDGAVIWSVTQGSDIAAVSENGTVTVNGVGNVTVKAARDGDNNHEALSAECSFTVQPAVLTVASVTAENKSYDGNKAVKINAVTLNGIQTGDEVSVSVSEVKGELADSKAAVYDKVTLSGLQLTGADAGKYVLTQPAAAVNTNVTVSKAAVPTALKDVQSTVSVDTTDLVIEHLSEGMPADAGELRYAAKHQDTVSGSKVVVLDWGVDEKGKLTSKLAGGAAGDRVIYEVIVSSDNYKDTTVKVEVTLGSLAVDVSKLTVTPASGELTYNGKEQKLAVEVKYENTVLQAGVDYDVTYPTDTTNAGEKELTVQFKGNYSGSTTAKYTITKAKVSVSGVQAKDKTYDGTTKATVSATLSGAVSGDDVKVAAAGTFADKNSGSNKTVQVTYTLSGDDAANYELTATTGTTTARISPVSSSALNGRISGLSTGNADSGNKSTLKNVVSQANSALQDTGLSASEKSGLTNVKYSAEDMIGRIESAAAAAATESIRKTADISSENVKLEDKALLEKAQSDLNSALTSYSGNYTKAEETEIQNKKDRVAKALGVITRVQSAQTLIGALPDEITEETVVDTALKTAVEDAQTAFAALNDYEKSLLSEDVQLKLTTVAQAVGEVEPTDDAAKDEAMNQISGTPEEGEGFKFPVWVLVIAVIAAGACGGGLFLYKRKQEQEELNW